MKYYRQQSCEEDTHLSFVEAGAEGVSRVVDIRPDSSSFPIISSNVELFIPEDDIDWEQLVEDPDNPYAAERITREEFEVQWKKNLARNENRWCEIKALYPVGSFFEGGLVVFIGSQSVIQAGPFTYAALCKTEYLKGTIEFELGPRNRTVKATISGYDERNQWLLLKDVSYSSELYPVGPRPVFTESQL